MPIPQNILDRLKAKDEKLTKLDLSRRYPSLTATDMRILAAALQGNPHVTELVLCENKIGNEGACVLAAILPTIPSLIELDVSINNIGDDGAKALFCVTTLRFLDIAANSVTNKAAEQLLENTTLHDADLDGNSVTADLTTRIKTQLAGNEQKEIAQLKEECNGIIEDLPPEKLKLALLALKEARESTQAQESFRIPIGAM